MKLDPYFIYKINSKLIKDKFKGLNDKTLRKHRGNLYDLGCINDF